MHIDKYYIKQSYIFQNNRTRSKEIIKLKNKKLTQVECPSSCKTWDCCKSREREGVSGESKRGNKIYFILKIYICNWCRHMLPAALWPLMQFSRFSFFDHSVNKTTHSHTYTLTHTHTHTPVRCLKVTLLAHYSYAPVGKFMNSPAHLSRRHVNLHHSHTHIHPLHPHVVTHTHSPHTLTISAFVCLLEKSSL